jgi:hypothetical protein
MRKEKRIKKGQREENGKGREGKGEEGKGKAAQGKARKGKRQKSGATANMSQGKPMTLFKVLAKMEQLSQHRPSRWTTWEASEPGRL